MNLKDEQYLCSRLRVIDAAVGGLQSLVDAQQELIDQLIKRIDKLEDNR